MRTYARNGGLGVWICFRLWQEMNPSTAPIFRPPVHLLLAVPDRDGIAWNAPYSIFIKNYQGRVHTVVCSRRSTSVDETIALDLLRLFLAKVRWFVVYCWLFP